MFEPSNHPRRHLTAPQWQALLQRFDGSTLSVVAFCRQELISESSFYRWRQKLADTPVTQQQRFDAVALRPVRCHPSRCQPDRMQAKWGT